MYVVKMSDIKMDLIDMEVANRMVDRIVGMIDDRLFGGSGSYRLTRIQQNVRYAVYTLLGKMMPRGYEKIYCKEYAEAHVGRVVRVGETVGIIAAQSFNQPVTQAVLKSQHRTAGKETLGANSLITMNSMTVKEHAFKIHFKPDVARLETLDSLAKKYEEVMLEDVLSSTHGDSVHSPEIVNKNWPVNFSSCYKVGAQGEEFEMPGGVSDYSAEPLFLYFNHRFMGRREVVYRYYIDPSKLRDAGLTHMDIINVLQGVKNLMVVIHPLSTFTFDIVPNPDTMAEFPEAVKKIMQTRLKGVPGLLNIGERKVCVTGEKGIVKREYYDTKSECTYLFLNPSAMLHFPTEELKKRVTNENGSQAEILYEKTQLFISETVDDELFHIRYKGKVSLDLTPYTYYIFTGSLSMKDLLAHNIDGGITFADVCDQRYILSNDPSEMIGFVGRTGARVIHEYNYSEELNNAGTPLIYQHITLFCRRMFGLTSDPIRAVSYMKSKNPNALDKFGYQNYQKSLEHEIIKGTRSSTKDLPSAVIVGRRPVIGTGAIELEKDPVRMKEVINLYSEARRDQQYHGKYPGITFPKIGEVKPMTQFRFKPFGDDFRFPGIVPR
jgi:hypothetical protein